MIPQYYPIEKGRLYGGEYPGDRDRARARSRLKHLLAEGIRTFVDLTAPADQMTSYEGLLRELEEEAGVPLRRITLPLPDMGVPENADTMQQILNHIKEACREAPAVYVHCWGGIGRTGTVVGCWLRASGHAPESALREVQKLYGSHMAKVRRHPESPQTPAQIAYVRNW